MQQPIELDSLIIKTKKFIALEGLQHGSKVRIVEGKKKELKDEVSCHFDQ